VVDLLAGQVQVYFGSFAASIELVRSGKLRALAVTTAGRAPALPDVPAMAEFLPGFEASIYVGIAAPHGTPSPIVDKLNTTMGGALADATITHRIADLGDMPLSLSPAEFTKLVAAEYDKWAGVIRLAGVRAE
jgi:tripartite-type tricarboxylate transporter receptor subunit TctC